MSKIEKLDCKDIMQRFNVPAELEDEIKKRIKRIERIGTISKAVLNKRSLAMQKMYMRLKDLSEAQVSELQKIVNDWDIARKAWENDLSSLPKREKKQASEKKLSRTLEVYSLNIYDEPELTAIRDFQNKAQVKYCPPPPQK